MAFNFDAALKAGKNEQQIREYLSSKGRSQEADTYFGSSTSAGKGIAPITEHTQDYAAPNEDPSVGGFIKNVFSSGGATIGGIASMVAHPIQTGKALGELGAGAVEKLIPGKQKSEEKFDAVAQFYKDRYGSWDAVKKTAYEDPIGFALDASSILSGAGAAVGAVSKTSKVASVLKTASKIADPFQSIPKVVGKTTKIADAASGGKLSSAATKARGAAQKVVSGVAGVTTGAGSGAFDTAIDAIRSGGKKGEVFHKALMGETSADDIVKAAREAEDEVRTARNTAYQAQLKKIGADKTPIDTKFLADQVNDVMKPHGEGGFGVTFKGKNKKGVSQYEFGTGSTVGDKGERALIADALNEVKSVTNKKGGATAIELDALKQKLSGMTLPEGKSSAFMEKLRSAVSDTLSKKVKGYDDLVKPYEAQTKYLQDVKKVLSTGDNASIETTLKKLTSIGRDNFEVRQGLVSGLDSMTGSNIEQMVAGYSLKGYTPKGLSKTIATGIGGVGIVSGGLPPLIPALALSSPRLVINTLRGLNIVGEKATLVLRAINALRKANGMPILNFPADVLKATTKNEQE